VIVDAHQHFWSLARGDYAWLGPELEPLFRDYLPTDLQPLLRRAGVARTVLVQAAPTEEETQFMLEIAFANPFVAGVVGWVDMERPDFAERLASTKRFSKGYLKGIRPMVQDIADDGWIASPHLDGAFGALAASGLAFDALVKPRHLPYLTERMRRTPALRVVIDHGAKPAIADGDFTAWHQALGVLARETSAMCKLSGLLTEAGPGWTASIIRPYADAILALFGPDRVLWGSDWPVLNLVADYESWLHLTMDSLAGLPADAQAAVLGGNARRFYDWEGGEQF
jgi:L-fuconolactonase